VVVVGNLITSFDHAAAARIIATPSRQLAERYLSLMRRHVMATPADPESFRRAAVVRYAEHLGLAAVGGEPTKSEWELLSRLDAEFQDPAWLEGMPGPAPAQWGVKVRAGVNLTAEGEMT
jgi:hypothetical protein